MDVTLVPVVLPDEPEQKANKAEICHLCPYRSVPCRLHSERVFPDGCLLLISPCLHLKLMLSVGKACEHQLVGTLWQSLPVLVVNAVQICYLLHIAVGVCREEEREAVVIVFEGQMTVVNGVDIS